MKKVTYLLAMILGVSVLVPAASTFAATDCAAAPDSAVCQIKGGGDTTVTDPTTEPKLTDQIKIIVNILLFILGAIAVVVIVISGIRYATSGGDAGAVKGAKDTILYAVVGLVVAILAYAIVGFVLGQF